MNSVAGATSPLAEQARRVGVADRDHGFWGKEEAVPEVVLQRAVAAMRGDGREPQPQHLGLPPVHVAREGHPAPLRWSSHDNAAARWRLVAEDGGQEVAGGELQRSYEQATIVLPQDLATGYYRLTLEGAPPQEFCRVAVVPHHCHVAAGLQ